LPDDTFYREPLANLCQGDILVTPHLRIATQADILDADGLIEFTGKGRPNLGLIMNFDCEIDKPWSETVVVCPILPLNEISPNQRTNARKNRIAHLFFMPRYKAVLEDSVAVLNQQTTLDRTLIDLSKRVATLDKTGRFAFYAQFVRWISRWELTELTCPRCGVEFEVENVLPTRNPDDP